MLLDEPSVAVLPETSLRPQVSAEERRLRMGVVAVIPARGGSKGIKRKNLALLCGKPLIAYTIEAALRSRLVDRVLVSTDDREVADTAVACGAWVPWLRDARLGGDRTALSHVWEDAKSRLMAAGVSLKSLVKLLPTHPFRAPGLIDFLVGKTLEGYTAVSTMRRLRGIFRRYYEESGGRLRPVRCPLETPGVADWPMMRPYGLVSVNTFSRPHRQYFHVVDDPLSLIDIDTPRDLRLAEEVIRRGLFDFADTASPAVGDPGGGTC